MVEVDIPVERRRGRPNVRWKLTRKRDMTEAGMKKCNAINRASLREKINIFPGDRDYHTSQG